jgi:hypothetical protein
MLLPSHIVGQFTRHQSPKRAKCPVFPQAPELRVMDCPRHTKEECTMSTEKPIDPRKKAKKAIRKQVKKLIAAYGDDKALALVTALVAQAPAEKTAAATKA